MKKIFLLLAFTGILGAASASTVLSVTKATVVVNGDDKKGDDKKKDKEKTKEKACCKKDAKCENQKDKACCKKKTEEAKATTTSEKK